MTRGASGPTLETLGDLGSGPGQPTKGRRGMKTATMILVGGVLLGGIVLSSSLPVAAAGSKAKRVPADLVEARIKKLHSDLHITAAQESRWNDVAQMMRDNGKVMADVRKQRVDDAKVLGAVDDLKSYAAVIDAHADGVHKFIPVFQSLYDSMSDAQRKTADSVFRSRMLAAAKSGT
jgi:LTXXQ motif family protein